MIDQAPASGLDWGDFEPKTAEDAVGLALITCGLFVDEQPTGVSMDRWLAGALLDALTHSGWVVAKGADATALALAQQLVDTGYVDEHVVTFRENSYGLEHPIGCRPNLTGCIFHEWLASQPGPDEGPGRYVMTWAEGPDYTGPEYRASPGHWVREASKS